ncbi:helix-turn-helix domain-containing protein [Streptococcus parauberis]|uniref:helix-turn-helix domain-containing protein n=1 Tax=Streptococcus parauberis TaxID=1348 RepID=UPI0003111F6D|nr:helix-turn-helix domain-containing protein [Streptococcus parauberis]QBX17945.1 hypothetical protein Javan385_0042 [Streptococcus phage Javan385]UWM91887.1 helix-turn-helix domain-containing protein [Streptococcus parauberis]
MDDVITISRSELKALIAEEVAIQRRQVDWISIKELQTITGWGRTTLENWRDQGKFRYHQKVKGGKYTYDLQDVQRFLRSMNK